MGRNSKKNRRRRFNKNGGEKDGQNNDGKKSSGGGGNGRDGADVVAPAVVPNTAPTTMPQSKGGGGMNTANNNNNNGSSSRFRGGKNNEETTDNKNNNNPLYVKQQAFLSKLTHDEKHHFFSETHLGPDRRAALWMEQADLGESLVNQYAWATPTASCCLQIFQHFSPIVEMGCGSNAYWAHWMVRSAGDGGSGAQVDVVTYDVNVHGGGQIIGSHGGSKRDTTKNVKQSHNATTTNNSSFHQVRKGGPEVLSRPEIVDSNRTLFLCYPDEYDDDDDDDDDGSGGGADEEIEESVQEADDDDGAYGGADEDDEADDDDDDPQTNPPKRRQLLPTSFGWQCLDQYQGMYVIHVGELFLDANLCMNQAPWGRSSSPEFQQRLASEFHCILKVQLPSNWLHVRDSISVWKRTELCPIVFASAGGGDDDGDDDDDDDDDDDEEEEDEVVEYRYIPPEEMLPTDLAAPCVAHLLPKASSASASSVSISRAAKRPSETSEIIHAGNQGKHERKDYYCDGHDQKSTKRKRKSSFKHLPAEDDGDDEKYFAGVDTHVVVDSRTITDSTSKGRDTKGGLKLKTTKKPTKESPTKGVQNGDEGASPGMYITPW